MERLAEAFRRFLALAPSDGAIIACADEPQVRALLESSPWAARVIRYGLSAGNDWRASELAPIAQGGSEFAVWAGDKSVGQFSIPLPGEHNVKNALAALIVAETLGVDRAATRQALATFGGVRRRFEIKGKAAGVTVIDDYAHHPTAIRATLAAARKRYPGVAIWAVFQPHTFSRTVALFQEFVGAFGDADHVLVTEIYASRESRDASAPRASDLVEAIMHANGGRADARYCATFDEAVSELLKRAQTGDVIITLGAGDGFVIGEQVLCGLAGRQSL
jgi:UDP-N-acetylmuramate--alanine ligase